ncbi:ABC transporter permease [Lacisediminimonas profundi]|uniref:ABC transporter permease n=1 Tax=Lacisediminimonas profundi TaxID=2603856 RepID=UPI00124B7948|nr:ABC transporter permease [Lacisediminimonas profundi]
MRLPAISRLLVFPALLLAAWSLGASLTDPLLVPSPVATWQSLAALASAGDLWIELAISIRRVLSGVLIGALVGVPFGVALGAFRGVDRYLGAALPAVSATSSAIWAVLGVLWFGLSDVATVFVVAMTAAPLFAVNARDGVKAVDADLIQMGRSMGYSPLQVARKILLPSVLPSLFAGTRLAVGFGWRVGLVAEALGSPTGVGFRLKQAVDLMHTAEVFAWSVSVILIMLVIEGLVLNRVEARCFRWRKPAGASGPVAA